MNGHDLWKRVWLPARVGDARKNLIHQLHEHERYMLDRVERNIRRLDAVMNDDPLIIWHQEEAADDSAKDRSARACGSIHLVRNDQITTAKKYATARKLYQATYGN